MHYYDHTHFPIYLRNHEHGGSRESGHAKLAWWRLLLILAIGQAYPEQINVPTSYIIEVGDSVTLECPYRPGALIQRYDYIWRVGTGLSAVLITDTEPRYSIGGDLTINSTALSDKSPYYQCNVEIDNPNGNDLRKGSDFISLEILERPSFVQIPASRVVLENQTTSVIFTCGVRGSPRPEIYWKFNETNVTEHEAAERFQDDLISEDKYAVTRRLTFNQLQRTDSGSIICVARTAEPVFVISEKAALSVLTSTFRLDTGITDRGDLQVRFMLPAAIQDELQFRLRFIEAGADQQQERTVTGNFINQKSIFFMILKTELPFSQFTVQVAMEVDNVIGEFTTLSMLLDTDVPNPLPEIPEPECDNYLLKVTVPIIIGSSIGVLLMILLLIVVVVCLKKWSEHMNHIRERENEEMRERHEHNVHMREKLDKVFKEIKENPDKLEYCRIWLEVLKRLEMHRNEHRIEGDGEMIEPSKAAWQIYQQARKNNEKRLSERE